MESKKYGNIFRSIKIQENVNTKEYKIMFHFFGMWNTETTFFCENDKEAISDAEKTKMKYIEKYPYALFCGNRKVKSMNDIETPLEVYERTGIMKF